MKSLRAILIILVLSQAALAQISTGDTFGTVDIGALMADAEKWLDLDQQDAVVLFNGENIHWLPDGRRVVATHLIVWINTEHAINTDADLGLQYDADRQDLRVKLLRTWRDGKAIDSDSTAIVPTLPGYLSKAPDYANIVETIVMHDGIELPCILETLFEITDKEPVVANLQGARVLAGDDPTVQSEFVITCPKLKKLKFHLSDGLEQAEPVVNKNNKEKSWHFRASHLSPLPSPETADPLIEAACIQYSSWDSWEAFGLDIRRVWDSHVTLNKTLRDSVQAITEDVKPITEKAQAIAKFVRRMTRFAYLDERWILWSPRLPEQTFESAYGCQFDRAILAAALFREAGFEVFPFYRSRDYNLVNLDAPNLSQFEPIAVWVSGSDKVEAYFDPATCELRNGLTPIFGRTIWIPGSGDDPAVSWQSDGTVSLIDISLDLEVAEDGFWTGKGFLHADHIFTPYEKMEGVGSQAKDYLQELAGGMLAGIEISDFSPITFNRFEVEAGFTFRLTLPEADSRGRLALEMGDPGNGIDDFMPSGREMTHPQRTSSFRLPGRLTQKITISIPVEQSQLAYFPTAKAVENNVGSFKLEALEHKGKMQLTRELELTQSVIMPELWSNFRELMAEYQHEQGRRVLWK